MSGRHVFISKLLDLGFVPLAIALSSSLLFSLRISPPVEIIAQIFATQISEQRQLPQADPV